MDDERLERLPKWAQQEIDRLRRDVERWKAAASDGPADADTFLRVSTELRPISSGGAVNFKLGTDGRGRTRWIEARVDDDTLRVHSSGTLMVLPDASNAVRLLAEGW